MSKVSDRFVSSFEEDLFEVQKLLLKEEAKARNRLHDYGFTTKHHQSMGRTLRIILEHPMLHGVCAVCWCDGHYKIPHWSPASPTAEGSWFVRSEYGQAFKSATSAVRCRIKRIHVTDMPISPLVRAYMLTKLKGVR